MKLLLAAVVVLVLAAPAHALTLTDARDAPVGGPWQAALDRAIVPLAPGPVRFALAPCPTRPDAIGCAIDWKHKPTEIWIVPGAALDEWLLWHELGHAFDFQVMSARARSAWKAAVMDWRTGWDGEPRTDPPSERFAESYAACAVLGRRVEGTVVGAYGYRVGPRRHRRACRVIRQAAAGVFG